MYACVVRFRDGIVQDGVGVWTRACTVLIDLVSVPYLCARFPTVILIIPFSQIARADRSN